jgi:plastocyanin
MRRVGVVFAALALLLAGCTDDDGDVADDQPSESTSTTPTTAAVATTGVPLSCGPTDGPFFDVTAREFSFEPECDRLQVRLDQDLRVTNVGAVTHNVTIAPAYDQNIEPGKAFVSGKIGGGLQPGTYELECRLHRSRGMTATLEILAV